MRRNLYLHNHDLTRRTAFTLMESTASVLLVGILMIAALQALGASRRRESSSADTVLGQQLTSSLMNEILLQKFEEPDANQTRVFGPEFGEVNGNRSLFDDVDDYAGWTSAPPNDRGGAVLTGFSNWTRSVNVEWVSPETLAATSASFTGLKRITVTVTKSGKTKGSLVSYRSIAWADTIPSPIDATGNRAPVAVATSPNSSGYVGSAVTFNASSSSDPDGDYLSYVWNFGDGKTSDGKTVSKTYTASGNYTVVLTVYDGRGSTATAARTIAIYP